MRLRHGFILTAALAASVAAQKPGDTVPLLKAAEAQAIAAEVSGAQAKRTVQALSLNHRMRGSAGYRAAAELIRDRLNQYGLKEVEIISLPADGKIFYGTQRSRPGWNASFAELWEQRQDGAAWKDSERVASWAEDPIILAQDSVSGRAEAELVDVGTGAAESDYAGKDVRGKLVLVSGQPGDAAPLAVTKYGAAGIVSWAQNQKSAWWGDDQSLIRWGHLDTWEDPTFAFMVSPARAHAWQARLSKGETVRLHAEVKAERSPSAYLIPTAVIPGKDRGHEIVFSCHLDHPSPGANDNASGCSGILEIARTLNRLVADGKLPQPQRTIRFVWPCEVECTISLLNARPEFPKRALATVHMDMIGGNTDITHGSLTVEGSPPSLPSFVSDVGFAIARWVDGQSSLYADRGVAPFPLLDAEGTKNPLNARIGGFSEGSDHQVWAEGSWRVPVIYIADWPDIYIHTNKDVPGNLDPTKMKRAMFIAAGSAWYLANLTKDDRRLQGALRGEWMQRTADRLRRQSAMADASATEEDMRAEGRAFAAGEIAVATSVSRFGLPAPALRTQAPLQGGGVYRRVASLKGPMDGFGYSWFDDHLKKAGLARPALLDRVPWWEGPSYGYEALNLVDGHRSAEQIRAELVGSVGPAPLQEVEQYLETLARIGVIEKVER